MRWAGSAAGFVFDGVAILIVVVHVVTAGVSNVGLNCR